MASKFADKNGVEEDDDDSSSFEEIEDPVKRLGPVAEGSAHIDLSGAAEPKTLMTDSLKASDTTPPTVSSPPAASVAASMAAPASASSGPISEIRKEEPAAGAPGLTAGAAAGGLRDVLHEIRGLLLSQGKQIEQLTSEVAQLKTKVDR